MASTITLKGLTGSGFDDGRSIALLKVLYNGNTYDWQIYVGPDSGDLATFIQNCAPLVEAQIDAKELEWANLDPKTRTTYDPVTGTPFVVPIPKEEIVKPEIPDYKAQRRQVYPRISDQLDALWKGYGTPDFVNMQLAVYDAKIKYPKGITPDDKLDSIRRDMWNKVMSVRQRVLEGGAKVVVDGVDKWFNSDTYSRTQWLGMAMLGVNLPPGINWRTMDGSFVTLTPSLVQQVFNAVMTKEVVAFGNGVNLYNQIAGSSDPASVDITVGWPESFV